MPAPQRASHLRVQQHPQPQRRVPRRVDGSCGCKAPQERGGHVAGQGCRRKRKKGKGRGKVSCVLRQLFHCTLFTAWQAAPKRQPTCHRNQPLPVGFWDRQAAPVQQSHQRCRGIADGSTQLHGAPCVRQRLLQQCGMSAQGGGQPLQRPAPAGARAKRAKGAQRQRGGVPAAVAYDLAIEAQKSFLHDEPHTVWPHLAAGDGTVALVRLASRSSTASRRRPWLLASKPSSRPSASPPASCSRLGAASMPLDLDQSMRKCTH